MDIHIDTADEETLLHYLTKVKDTFIPPLDTQVDMFQYAEKIFRNAMRIECYSQQKLVGLCGVYFNDSEKQAYITTISVLRAFQKQGIAQLLLDKLIEICLNKSDINRIELEVARMNTPARTFYSKNDFQIKELKGVSLILTKTLN